MEKSLVLSTGERHEYGIMKQVQADSQGNAKMGPGRLYGSMGRMMEAGLIRESDKRVDSEMDDVRENITRMNQLGKTMLRVALVSLGLLLVPLVASRVVDGWNWNAGGFVFVYVLFFATGMAFALIARKMGVWTYKAGVGVALVAGFVLGWFNIVHVADSGNPKNFAYYSVLAVGLVGHAWRGWRREDYLVAMFIASGLLFRQASLAELK